MSQFPDIVPLDLHTIQTLTDPSQSLPSGPVPLDPQTVQALMDPSQGLPTGPAPLGRELVRDLMNLPPAASPGLPDSEEHGLTPLQIQQIFRTTDLSPDSVSVERDISQNRALEEKATRFVDALISSFGPDDPPASAQLIDRAVTMLGDHGIDTVSEILAVRQAIISHFEPPARSATSRPSTPGGSSQGGGDNQQDTPQPPSGGVKNVFMPFHVDLAFTRIAFDRKDGASGQEEAPSPADYRFREWGEHVRIGYHAKKAIATFTPDGGGASGTGPSKLSPVKSLAHMQMFTNAILDVSFADWGDMNPMEKAALATQRSGEIALSLSLGSAAIADSVNLFKPDTVSASTYGNIGKASSAGGAVAGLALVAAAAMRIDDLRQKKGEMERTEWNIEVAKASLDVAANAFLGVGSALVMSAFLAPVGAIVKGIGHVITAIGGIFYAFKNLMIPTEISGTDGDDSLSGNSKDNKIYGHGGDDTIWGRGGNDQIWGGDGDDRIWGGTGSDSIWGGPGNDTIRAGPGDDAAWGGPGDDRISGGADRDLLYGNDDNDLLMGGSGSDFLIGGSGSDRINGGAGDDHIYGDDAALQKFNAHWGYEVLSRWSRGTITKGFENSEPVFTDTPAYRQNSFEDTLVGGAGDDTLISGNSAFMNGQEGDDKFWVAAPGRHVILGGEGDDHIVFQYFNEATRSHFVGAHSAGSNLALGYVDLPAASPVFNPDDIGQIMQLPAFEKALARISLGAGNDLVAMMEYLVLQDRAAIDSVRNPFSSILLDYSIDASDEEKAWVIDLGKGTAFDLAGLSAKLGRQIDDGGNTGLSADMDLHPGHGLFPLIPDVYGRHNDAYLGAVTNPYAKVYTDQARELLGKAYNPKSVFGWGNAIKYLLPRNKPTGYEHDYFFGVEHVKGGDRDDIIRGTERTSNKFLSRGDNILYGGGGGDHIYGFSGNDYLHGGAGDDHLHGGEGNDHLHGGAGNDHLYGDAGDDVLYFGLGGGTYDGGAGTDTLSFAAAGAVSAGSTDYGYRIDLGTSIIRGNSQPLHNLGSHTIRHIENVAGSRFSDAIFGDAGDNVIWGLAGDDHLHGGAGNDHLHGGAGNDHLYGDAGDDVLYFGPGSGTYDGGAGTDMLSFAAAEAVTVGGTDYGYRIDLGTSSIKGNSQLPHNLGSYTINHIENVTGSRFSDVIFGDAEDNVLWGLAGDDHLHGGVGNDHLHGGAGNDRLYGGAGDDTLYASSGTNHLFGGAGDDTFKVGAGNSVIDGGTNSASGVDTLDYSLPLVLNNAERGLLIDYTLGRTYRMPASLQGVPDYSALTLKDSFSNIESIKGSVLDDRFVLGTLANGARRGEIRTVVLDGGLGTDTLDLRDVDSRYTNVEINMISGQVVISGVTTGTYKFKVSGFEKVIASNAGETVFGGFGTRSVDAGAGNDRISLLGGSATVDGGTGQDILDVRAYQYGVAIDADNGVDHRSYQTHQTFDAIKNGRQLVGITGRNIEEIIGSEFNDAIRASGVIGPVRAGAGNDVIFGGDESNEFWGDAGDDTLYGGAGDDRLSGGSGNDTLKGGIGSDSLDGGAGRDMLTGGIGDDAFVLGNVGASFRVADIITDFNIRAGEQDSISIGHVDRVWFGRIDADGDGDLDTVLYDNETGRGGIYGILRDYTDVLTSDDFLNAASGFVIQEIA